ncbi:MAG: hypothetical protein ACPL1A_09945 [Candidatus Kapaibacteriota bacterium]
MGTLSANLSLVSHGTIRGGSFLSALFITKCIITTIVHSSAFPLSY